MGRLRLGASSGLVPVGLRFGAFLFEYSLEGVAGVADMFPQQVAGGCNAAGAAEFEDLVMLLIGTFDSVR